MSRAVTTIGSPHLNECFRCVKEAGAISISSGSTRGPFCCKLPKRSVQAILGKRLRGISLSALTYYASLRLASIFCTILSLSVNVHLVRSSLAFFHRNLYSIHESVDFPAIPNQAILCYPARFRLFSMGATWFLFYPNERRTLPRSAHAPVASVRLCGVRSSCSLSPRYPISISCFVRLPSFSPQPSMRKRFKPGEASHKPMTLPSCSGNM